MTRNERHPNSFRRQAVSGTQSLSTMQRGFTLVELVLVLIILAILATAALNMVEVQVDQTRFETTQTTLRKCENSIYVEKTNPDGTTTQSGYFVDMGGVPIATPELDAAGNDILTVRSLWQMPPGVLTYANRPVEDLPAVVANTDNDLDGNSDGEDDDLDGDPVNGDRDVIIGTGWRGPYLVLPIGADEITDAWANVLVSYVDANDDPNADYPYRHLRGDGDTDVTTAGQSVYGLRSLGNDDLGDDLFTGGTYDRDLPALTTAITLSSGLLFGPVVGTVSVEKSLDGDAAIAVPGDIIVQLYYPDSATGRVRIERATIVNARLDPTTDRDLFDYKFEEGNSTPKPAVQFPRGLRAVRAYLDDSNDSGDFGDGTNDPSSKSRIEYRSIVANTNRIDITLD